jgi:hypothetical protein
LNRDQLKANKTVHVPRTFACSSMENLPHVLFAPDFSHPISPARAVLFINQSKENERSNMMASEFTTFRRAL